MCLHRYQNKPLFVTVGNLRALRKRAVAVATTADHRQLFAGLPQPLRAYFDYAFQHHARGDVIRALSELGSGPSWEKVLADRRNMWSTASLTMAAGRVLAETNDGWRFIAKEQAGGLKLQLLEMLPITCEADDAGVVRWSPKTGPGNVRIFHRKPDGEHVRAMAEATNALFRQILPT